MEEEIDMNETQNEQHLFMICTAISRDAFSSLPEGLVFRKCQKNELRTWMHLQFDSVEEALLHEPFMTDYFYRVYHQGQESFFDRCTFVCDSNDKVVASAFLWKAYGQIWTLHWFKVNKQCEGRGIGRALLTHLLHDLSEDHLPIYLHTHPTSERAIKLYLDFGFRFLNDPWIGKRFNAFPQISSELASKFPITLQAAKASLQAPKSFLTIVNQKHYEEF